jgi:hypothetical protein
VNQSTNNAIAAMQAYAGGTTGGVIYQANNKVSNIGTRNSNSNDH